MKQINFKNISTTRLAQMVNRLSPGTIKPTQIQSHIRGAKFAIGEKTKIDLVLYLAWLRKNLDEGNRLNEKDKRSQAEVMRERRANVRDIGKIPRVKNLARRQACERDLARWLKTYMLESFPLPWSQDHLDVLKKNETSVLVGALYAQAVFRAFGKTTMVEGTAIWAAVNGHRAMVPIIGATESAARMNMASIQREFTDNPLIAEDYPEVCFPVQALEGVPARAQFLTYKGKSINMEWKKNELITLPFIPGSKSAGVIILARSLTGENIRGIKHKRIDGSVIRPDFLIIDDPQTRESAESLDQTNKREKIITGDLMGMGGHRKSMSAVACLTIIAKGDLSSRLLDRELHPEWQGDIFPMVKKWSERHKDLWLKTYADLRREDIPDYEGGREKAERQATEFYAKRREDMDKGCEVSWEWAVYPGELSAIQHAYNLLIDRGEYHFQAEYQNQPLDEFAGTEPPLEPRDVLKKLNGIGQLAVPLGYSLVTAFIDPGIQAGKDIHYCVCAFDDDFSGAVIDYGKEIVKRNQLGGIEAALTGGIRNIIQRITGMAYRTQGGEELRARLILIDSGKWAKTIYRICAESFLNPDALLVASKGQGGGKDCVSPKRIPKRFRGSQWFYTKTRAGDARLLTYNTDYFKSLVAERIRTEIGGKGSLTLWGDSKQFHLTFAEHATAEPFEIRERADGTVFEKFLNPRPGSANDYGDCLVGCHVAAARLGVEVEGEVVKTSGGSGGGSIKLSDLQG